LALYDRALPQVYGYLVRRVRSATIAEDLTSDTFLAAVRAVKRDTVPEVSVAWLITIARHKLVDHWRRQATEREKLPMLYEDDAVDDDLDVHFERQRALAVLDRLGSHHQVVLSLRYLDGLSVPEVAELIDRTVHATEALLVRARHAFRMTYEMYGGEVG
jgi:RNA polymerase sigma-70 factor (ECF subfamily)